MEFQKQRKQRKLSTVSNSEWMLLADYVTVLKHAADGLDILQGDNASLGYVMPTLFAIKKRISSSMLNTVHGERLRDTLLKTINDRFSEKLELHEENKYLILAAAFHPLFKLEWVPQEYEEIVRDWFFDELRHESNNELQESVCEQPDEPDFFFSIYDNK